MVESTESPRSAPKPSRLRIGRRYRPIRLEGPYDVIVIGSGIGGLTTAAMLSASGKKVLVLNVMGQLFMEDLDDAFACMNTLLGQHRLGATVDAVVLDFHAEATSEKMAAGHFVDGRVSLFVGTHTHVPTADTMILNGGSAYQSDAGMCGSYDSVIGMDKVAPLERFVKKVKGERLSVASGEGTLCGVFVETDDSTGLARRAAPVRIGGRLSEAVPD